MTDPPKRLLPSERLLICAACPHYNLATHRCRLCGCYMQFKARIPYLKCPDGRW